MFPCLFPKDKHVRSNKDETEGRDDQKIGQIGFQFVCCRLSAGTLQIVFMIFAGCLLFISISLLSLEFSFDFHVNKKRDRLADGLTDPHVEMRRRN